MKTIFKFGSVAAVVLALAQTLQAVPITGDIGFTGRAVFDTSSAGTASEVVNWVNPQVNGTAGAFTSVADGTSVNFTSPWFFLTLTPVNGFWSVGGFTFQLLSSAVVSHNGSYPSGYVEVTGTGIVSGNGYTPTELSWSFTSQDPAATTSPTTFTFSASATSDSVPDGGTTVAMLGLGLFGVSILRKKLAI
jgi:hypothetical protein